jgi:hypothetical protein
VIGATGYIGGSVAQALMTDGHEASVFRQYELPVQADIRKHSTWWLQVSGSSAAALVGADSAAGLAQFPGTKFAPLLG